MAETPEKAPAQTATPTKAAAKSPLKAQKAKAPPKAKAPKDNAPKKPAKVYDHPSYSEMVKEAIQSLKDRTGSSMYAITKYIELKYHDLPSNWKRILAVQVKNLTQEGKLVKVKASFKLGESLKAPAKAAAPRPRESLPKPSGAKKATGGLKKAQKAPKAVKSTKNISRPRVVKPHTPKVAKKATPAKKAEPVKKAKVAVAPKPKSKAAAPPKVKKGQKSS